MQITRRNMDGLILQHGEMLGDFVGATTIDVPDALAMNLQQVFQQPNGGVLIDQSLTQIQVLPVSPSAPIVEPPDIAGIINALAQSPSIDQPTKDALTAALKGQ